MTSRIASLLAAVLLLTVPVRAQNVGAEEGRFTLPFAASWGDTILPAGDYSVRLLPRSSTPAVFCIEGEGVQAIVMASQSSPSGSATGVLTLLRQGDSRTVVSLHLAGISTSFLPRQPDPVANGEQLAQTIETVSVATAE